MMMLHKFLLINYYKKKKTFNNVKHFNYLYMAMAVFYMNIKFILLKLLNYFQAISKSC